MTTPLTTTTSESHTTQEGNVITTITTITTVTVLEAVEAAQELPVAEALSEDALLEIYVSALAKTTSKLDSQMTQRSLHKQYGIPTEYALLLDREKLSTADMFEAVAMSDTKYYKLQYGIETYLITKYGVPSFEASSFGSRGAHHRTKNPELKASWNKRLEELKALAASY